jgi:hypothetical protein
MLQFQFLRGAVMRAVACAAFLIAYALNYGYAQPDKVQYELQERCGKRATEVFEKDFPEKSPNVIAFFENHYNARLNKCFMVEETTTHVRDDKNKPVTIKILILIDVNDNKVIANFDPLQCTVQERTCHSEQEWRLLVKPLMQE